MADMNYNLRTDSVTEKLRLFQSAYAARNYDLAMSLAESIKDTLVFERQMESDVPPPEISAGGFSVVDELPGPWAAWAQGWSFYTPLALFDTIAAERVHEPVDIAIAFPAEQATHLHREVRVARVDTADGMLHEVPSQIYEETRSGQERRCRLVFMAEVPAHGRSNYLVFYGNPDSELPDYETDLRIHGEGYGLDIENAHYVAKLSRQMGQLERVIYRRQHGLELFAGGKGHGEPPTIDWAHDYVDPGHFQKFRMRNWPQCPSFDVVKGPLCVRVRRWGFPHSPIHPVFAPSRMHMDQTYIFYAGLPFFFKEGRMDVVKDMEIEAMRDDEWVLSGYSFTDTVWIDRQGKLHEGSAPNEDLWGVGFFHRDSRDAFIALWLDHSADKFDGLLHGGAPTLHYDGHGQLWSRYPANRAAFRAGVSLRQKNAYLLSPYPRQGGAAQVETLRHRLLNPIEVRFEKPPPNPAKSTGTLARRGEAGDSTLLKPLIWKTLRAVRDEQLYNVDANIVDMGYVYDVRVRDGIVTVLVTMPHRGRPVFDFLVWQGGGRVEEGIRERLLRLDGVREVVVNFTWYPRWTTARLTDAGRSALGLSG